MTNEIIKCPHCGKIFFSNDNKECPFCGKDLYNYLDDFKKMIGDNNPFSGLGKT